MIIQIYGLFDIIQIEFFEFFRSCICFNRKPIKNMYFFVEVCYSYQRRAHNPDRSHYGEHYRLVYSCSCVRMYNKFERYSKYILGCLYYSGGSNRYLCFLELTLLQKIQRLALKHTRASVFQRLVYFEDKGQLNPILFLGL